jgi:hypothetical protein
MIIDILTCVDIERPKGQSGYRGGVNLGAGPQIHALINFPIRTESPIL